MEPLVGSSVAFSLSPEKNLWQTWSSGYTRVIKHLLHIIQVCDIIPSPRYQDIQVVADVVWPFFEKNQTRVALSSFCQA